LNFFESIPDAQVVVFPWDFCVIRSRYPNQPEKKRPLPISREVEKIMGQNFYRLYKDVIG